MLSHITTLSDITEEFHNLGSPVTEQQLIMKTLHALPPSFTCCQSTLPILLVVDKTMVNITNRLIAEEFPFKTINSGGTPLMSHSLPVTCWGGGCLKYQQ
jgi:hypothetical protein